MSDDELLAMMKQIDPATVRLPPGIKLIVHEAIATLEADLATLRAQNAQLENDCNMLSLDRQELQERLAGYEWQPIKTAPKDGTVILVSVESTDLVYTVEWRDEAEDEAFKDDLGIGWRLTWDGYFFPAYDQPTYWMHLPPAKEGTKS